ncbi:aspartic peptidase domain-containing protein [Mycena alexandri]|uniref:Aspartic peptidase domain-containing protein n=1 Tax=Mycena alexandri TaxID=1745969 RepID=A0AAD6T2Z9_9AGAR|nr:aspartic peptidase domain-containing protein [Mycena alexandri]
MSLLFLLPSFVFFSLFALADAQIATRDVPPPQTLVIPLSMHTSQVYSVKVNMSSNASPQSFSFALSTSTAITTVAGADCDSCGGVPSYNPSASSSVQQLPQAQNVSTLNGTASGAVVREYCGLLQSNGSAWVYPNQTVTVANQSASFFSPGVSGMIGVGLAPFVDSPAANWLAQNPTQPTFSFGMALNSPSNFSTDGGVLHWLQPDPSFYQGDIAWKPMLAANASIPSNRSSWFVEMDAWSVSGGSSSFNISQSGTELLTLLDPFYSTIVFPQSSARAIYADIPGASKHATSAFAHSWKLPCDSKFRLTVTFGTFSTSLDQTSLVVKQADGVCVGALQEWIDASATEYLLGSPFIAVLYLIFSYSQQGNGSVGVAARIPASNKLSPGALAGVILGTVAVVALLIIAGVLLYFTFLRRSAKAPHKRKLSKTDVTPFPSDFTESTSSRRSLRPNNYNGQQQGEPWSPDWQTTLLSESTPSPSPNTNTFPGGTTYGTQSSHAYYRTEVDSSPSLIHLDSPPPYAIPPGASPVPLLPLRKNRQPS